jgi:hypothetical protein
VKRNIEENLVKENEDYSQKRLEELLEELSDSGTGLPL